MRYYPKSKNQVDDIQKLSVAESVQRRIPWLMIGLLGGLAAAGIISSFEEIISQNLFLASFIPLIVYISDAVGSQMEAFAIRDFALHTKLKFHAYFLKQFVVVSIISIVLGIVLFIVSLMLKQDPTVSVVLSVSLFLAIISSITTGLLIPYIFNKINLDPANASGPIATVIQDILSIIIYFNVAHFLLG